MAEELTAGNTQATGEAPAATAAPAQTSDTAAAPAGGTPPAQEAATEQQTADGKAAPTGEKPAEGAKPDGEKPAEGTKEGEKPTTTGAPEAYEFKAPDGTSLNEAVIGAYSEIAKELDLSQDAAQKILDKVSPVMAAQQAEQIREVRAGWLDTTKADKEFGGEKLTENVAIAKKALDAFGTPELRKLLDDTGLGDHPELIRAFYRAGKAISQDRFVAAGSGTPGAKSDAKVLYPNSNMN